MPVQQELDCDTFLAHLRASGLLDDDELAQVNDLAAGSDGGRPLARRLVEHGLLTRFQAEKIYRGRTDGFNLGQYRVLDQIGRGGMGRVFKAEHRTMKRIVAIKVLSPEMTKTERARKLFQREVRAAARLTHPNIVTAYDANQSGDRHYLVMEFVDGPNLLELVKECGPLPIGQACDFMRQAALGLHYAHEMGMVHRDIKPANLLVQCSPGGSCVVKILDFGLARLHEPDPQCGYGMDSIAIGDQTVMGTPDYISPEQARNLHAVDIRSDLYSLGCTMYVLLTGRVPFPGGTAVEKLIRHGREAATPVHELRDVSPLISALVAKLMAKRPEERFQSPQELAHELAPYAEASFTSLRAVNASDITPSIATGESPWSEMIDDAQGAGSTMPADMTVTPIHRRANPRRSLRQSIRQLRQQVLPTPERGWARLAFIAAAALAGFLIGVASLFMLMK